MKVSKRNNKLYLHSELLDKNLNIKHIFSTVDFGNQGLHVGDIAEKVIENRKRLADFIEVDPSHLTSAKQVHGTNIKIVELEDRGKGAFDYEEAIDDCDGLITKMTYIPLFSFYADCTPIYLYDPVEKIIGILHAGWKGTLNNIAGKSVDLVVEKFNSKPENLIYIIGPAISLDNYEVSEEIIDQLADLKLDTLPFVKGSKISLAEINRENLKRKGVCQIEVDEHCTYKDKTFFSYRRDGKFAGRMAAIIMITDEVTN